MMQKRDEKSDPERQENGLKQAAQSILVALGEDLQREGLGDTPQRFADLFTDFFCGYREPKPNLSIFTGDRFSGEISFEKISFSSFCEHHLVPFYGHVEIRYTPAGQRLTGFGSVARLLAWHAGKLQIQERLTQELGEDLVAALQPQQLFVRVSAEHFCMRLHGAKKEGVPVFTSFAWPEPG
jgi:GTP cyclohydrolase I